MSLFPRISVPPWIGPPPVAQHKDLGNASGGQRSLAAYLGFIQIPAVGNRNVAKTLNFGAWELEPNEFSTRCVKFSGGLKHLGLVVPILLTGADDQGVPGHQLFESFGVICKPGAPHGFAHLEELPALVGARCPTECDEGCQQPDGNGGTPDYSTHFHPPN